MVEDELSKGNDQKAFSIYQATLTNLESIESEIESNSNTGDQNDGADNQDSTDQQDGQTPEDPNTGGTSDPSTDPSTEGSGAGILPIILVVFILLVAGFIFYTSYIPEPGDPLYEYIGEKQ